ncbi:hypothetical protein BGZ60DRAFT_5713 [Tricladium varicosporioides]|nr:hypothetical protein BGZ60DRAFT_5713 [Hymenoscyphus varicosporioides]
MESTDPVAPAQRSRRSRVEGKRSKLGCRTCVSKKVKCDETKPICARCERLKLTCVWEHPKEKLSSRRRGFGPVKERLRVNWTPPSIIPKVEKDLTPASEEALTPSISINSEIQDWGTPSRPEALLLDGIGLVNNSTELRNASGEELGMPEKPAINSWLSATLDNGAEDPFVANPQRNTLTNDQETLEQSSALILDVFVPSHIIDTPIEEWESSPFTFQDPVEYETLMNVPSPMSFPFVGYWNSPLSLEFDERDNQALLYFRRNFPSLKSARSHTWSAHAVFFNQALHKRPSLHFLLALSHNELALHCGLPSSENSLSREARQHYETGSQLLLQCMTGEANIDYIGDLTSFLYMYMFWMRRDKVYPQRLRQISQGVLNYVKTHNVISLCLDGGYANLSSNLSRKTSLETSKPDSAFIARLLIYLYDRDVYCAFYNCGGHFADFLNSDIGDRQRIWAISRTFMMRYWGKSYPRDEFTKDIEQAPTYDMYFNLITICQQINNYSRKCSAEVDETEENRLRTLLDSHQIEHSLLFHFVSIGNSARPCIPLFAYVSITFFHALQIYLLRSGPRGFGAPRCAFIDRSLGSLISTAHLALTTGQVQLLERFQWALFIAGIETEDVVHRDWVYSSISDLQIKKLLTAILDRKKQLGGEITMSTIRQMICGDPG